MTVDPQLRPGRRLYEEARKLRKAKLAFLLRRGVTVTPREPAKAEEAK